MKSAILTVSLILVSFAQTTFAVSSPGDNSEVIFKLSEIFSSARVPTPAEIAESYNCTAFLALTGSSIVTSFQLEFRSVAGFLMMRATRNFEMRMKFTSKALQNTANSDKMFSFRIDSSGNLVGENAQRSTSSSYYPRSLLDPAFAASELYYCTRPK